MADIESWIKRIDAIEGRLRAQLDRSGGTTAADERTGETWERGQVWGHLAEFIAFWTEQAGDVIDDYQGEPVPFGRKGDNSARNAAVESGLEVPIATLWEEVKSDLAELRRFLLALPEDWSSAVGNQDGRELRAEEIIERRLIAHLEEHAAQLEAI
ncbi:MAG TPA: hypothetical protein VJQ57_11320 [Acidimicrobiia bacterium]|nr:hypothetical protein [Acidimicrobiia bacterium]